MDFVGRSVFLHTHSLILFLQFGQEGGNGGPGGLFAQLAQYDAFHIS